MGTGRGGLAPEEETKVGFEEKRGKVHTGKGAIIGQFLVDGEQVPGEVSSDMADLVSAAERDASDLINRDRIPRQYQKAIKEYFSNVSRDLNKKQGEDAETKPAKPDGESADAETNKGQDEEGP